MVDLSIVIVNYYSADFVLACVRSISERTCTVAYEVIVVDNASCDGCGERLAQQHPEVIFVQGQSNLGFGRANNLGAKHASGEVLLFLNPDTEVCDRAVDCLYAQFKKLEKPGAVGSKLLNSDGTFQTSCVQPLPTVLNQVLDADVLMHMFPKSRLWGGAALIHQAGAPAKVEVVSGACLMIQKCVYERVGGFSPEYFMYAEDLDLCFKTRREGLNNYYIGDAVIVHHGGGSTNRSASNFSNVMMRESVYRFLLKSRGRLYGGCYRAALGAAALGRMALLASLYPVGPARDKRIARSAAFRKWLAILRWVVGLERWIRKYDIAKTKAAGTAAAC